MHGLVSITMVLALAALGERSPTDAGTGRPGATPESHAVVVQPTIEATAVSMLFSQAGDAATLDDRALADLLAACGTEDGPETGSSGHRAFAVGGGVAVGQGITKRFAFAAHQRTRSATSANGYAVLVQDDPTGVYGDFRLQGPVQCLAVAGDRAVIGIRILRGSGTAAGHEGEIFYLKMSDGRGLVPDEFDNSGYTGSPTGSCFQSTATGQVVMRGNILVSR